MNVEQNANTLSVNGNAGNSAFAYLATNLAIRSFVADILASASAVNHAHRFAASAETKIFSM